MANFIELFPQTHELVQGLDGENASKESEERNTFRWHNTLEIYGGI